MDNTVRFWRDLLGMRIVLTMGEDGRRMYFLEVSGANMSAYFESPEQNCMRRRACTVYFIPEPGCRFRTRTAYSMV